jgi:cytochrome c-type biogenesis protein CcmH
MRRLGLILTLALGLGLGLAAPLSAVEPDEILANPNLEARARALSKNIRCLVCQNQSIDDSNASLAKDLRVIVRERLVAGDDDDAIQEFLVARYGEFVLLKPRVTASTYALWYGPGVILAFGAIGAAVFLARRREIGKAAPLDDAEMARLAELLDDAEGEDPSREPRV